MMTYVAMLRPGLVGTLGGGRVYGNSFSPRYWRGWTLGKRSHGGRITRVRAYPNALFKYSNSLLPCSPGQGSLLRCSTSVPSLPRIIHANVLEFPPPPPPPHQRNLQTYDLCRVRPDATFSRSHIQIPAPSRGTANI